MSHEGLTPLEQIARDTIKLVIEIPKRDYEDIKKAGIFTYPRVAKAIREATTLDEVKAEISEIPKKYPMTVDYENGLNEALDIIDNIGKGEKE